MPQKRVYPREQPCNGHFSFLFKPLYELHEVNEGAPAQKVTKYAMSVIMRVYSPCSETNSPFLILHTTRNEAAEVII